MPAGWYPDPMQQGNQREWNGREWVGPSVPLAAKGGFPKWLIPLIACGGLAFVALIGGAIASAGDEDPEQTAATDPAVGQFARCNDGEFSDNGDLRAICSSHDGVDEFLAEFGECEDGTVIALRDDPECPDGGDLVKLLPGYQPAAGDGDIALCNDGTYSDNRELRNTCSSHDGVEEWLAEYGECEGGDVVRLAEDERCPMGEDLSKLLPGYTPPTTTAPPATTSPPTTTAPPTTTSPPTTTAPPGPTLSPSQQQAVGSAQNYLEFSGFSRQGLIDQLSSEFGDQFSVEDATVAVDSLNVDWNAEAAESAQNYLEFSNFSCQGLIDQLSSEFGDQYTVEEATYGANQTGIC
ncbi:Ltp family lipoprotein [Iamia majanohamensis]|uniref:Ltp family lipoprotein n=2 Tax=Iamia majanohamensis TaxID=467976 RepID=A0AAF0BTP5_9ACTN|nr:Ltp family lipoprotein [Iamia majanohamensis]WCO65048.1 Ltp family lipoprotein [Iamia majanohamensis]